MTLNLEQQINFLKQVNACFYKENCKAQVCSKCQDFQEILSLIRITANADAVLLIEYNHIDNTLSKKLFNATPTFEFDMSEIVNFFHEKKNKISKLLIQKRSNPISILQRQKMPIRQRKNLYISLHHLAVENTFLAFVWQDKNIFSKKLIDDCLHIINGILRWKQMHIEFLKMNKIQLAGLMSGAVAHDLNNIISGVLSALELTKYNSIDEKNLQEIRYALKRGAEMLGNLLGFIRENKTLNDYQILDLNKTVKNTFPLLKLMVNKKCNLNVEFSNNPILIKGVPSKIEQVLMNLITNARDAISTSSKKGKIRIKLACVAQNKQFLPTLNNKSLACISITDNGCGIAKDKINKIFTPLFSTKLENSGTGLGLFIVKNIVEAHDGFIDVKSRVGKGTTFSCYFPLID